MTPDKVPVIAAVIERDGRFLLGKRSAHKKAAGYWCPICGRVEPGESQARAVEREVLEETGLVVTALEKVAECDTHDGHARMYWWRARPVDDIPARLANDEHTALIWVNVTEMKQLAPVFEEDVEIFARVTKADGG